MRKFIQILTVISASIFLSACHNHDHEEDGHGHSHDAEVTDGHSDTHQEDAIEVVLSKEQLEIIDVQFSSMEKKQLTATLKANGFLKVPNQNRASITSLMNGIVKNIYVQPGDFVKKGQTIATISNTSFVELQENFLTTKSKIVLANLALKRQLDLQVGNAGAAKNLQAAEAELEALQTRMASLKKQLEMIGIQGNQLTNDNIRSEISITSPISGAISHILVNIGDFVDAQNSVADVVDNSRLHVDLFVYEKDLSKLKVGQLIHFTLTSNPVKEYDAEIHAISNTFEKNMKAVSVHAEVSGNKAGLIDGMNISAIISLEDAVSNAVPNSAIVSHEGQDYILIVQEDQHEGEILAEGSLEFVRIPIIKGTSDIGYSEIATLQEIPSNARIVTNGAFFILAKMTNQGEGHSH
jgi:membrane fusion protein, heavy metal efflux system